MADQNDVVIEISIGRDPETGEVLGPRIREVVPSCNETSIHECAEEAAFEGVSVVAVTSAEGAK